MKYPARNDRNAGLTGPAIGETLPAARQREMNRQPGRMSGAGHHQTYPAILPGERDCPLFPYRRQILLSGERHSGLSGIENQTKGGVIMAMDYLTKESEEVRQAFSSLDRTALVLRQAAENYSPSIQSKRYLTGEEVCEYLHISPRTLQTLRTRVRSLTPRLATGCSSIPKQRYERYCNEIVGRLSLIKQKADGNYFCRPFAYLLSDFELVPDLSFQCSHIPPDLVVGDLRINLCRGDMFVS